MKIINLAVATLLTTLSLSPLTYAQEEVAPPPAVACSGCSCGHHNDDVSGSDAPEQTTESTSEHQY